MKKINDILSIPKLVLIKTLLNIFKRKLRSCYITFKPITLSNQELLNLSEYNNLNGFIYRRVPPFFFDFSNQKQVIKILEKIIPESMKKSVADADETIDHTFNLLGSGKIDLGKNIDWHTDFKNGFRWDPKKYYVGTNDYLDYYINGVNADVKFPWELSRFQHLVTIGKAYWFTNNEKYAKEFVDQIESWINNNPIEMGINWASTMDVTIRAVNWIWGYYFFYKSNTLEKDFLLKFFKILILHGKFIENNLEYYEIRNNHYISNLVGLIYLGIFFQDTDDGKRWLDKGISALEEEMKVQVYPDGVDYESSINYHRLVTELFISATVLCIKNEITFSHEYMKCLEKMIEYIMYYTKPDGTSPQIGDSDDGRLHILSDYGHWNKLDHRYLLSIGASLFDRPDFICKYPEFNEEAFWVLGEDLKSFDIINYDIESKSFPISGYYIMRENDLYMIVDCSSPQVNSFMGHRHNSALNFELFVCGKSFIIDPGSYIYTADKKLRNLFRSTEYHNVIKVDHFQQNDYNEDEIFGIGSDAKLTVNKWEIKNEYDFLDAEHYGYSRIDNPVLHRRKIYFNKKEKYWLINDILTGEGEHKFDLYFHFAPMKLEFYKEYPFAVKSDLEDENIIVVPLNKEELSAKIIDGWVSYSYGMKYKAPILKYSKHMKVPTIFTTLIYPFKNQKDLDHISKEIQIIIEEENKNEVIIE